MSNDNDVMPEILTDMAALFGLSFKGIINIMSAVGELSAVTEALVATQGQTSTKFADARDNLTKAANELELVSKQMQEKIIVRLGRINPALLEREVG